MSEYAVTSHADVKANLHAFFSGLGWTVGGTTAEPTVTPLGGTKTYGFTVHDTGQDQGFEVSDTSDNTFKCLSRSPILAGSTYHSVSYMPPTRLFAFGEADWAALVIQYSTNLYRHIYLGVVDKIGNYNGGDILNCNNQMPVHSTMSINSVEIDWLFNGYRESGSSWPATRYAGAVRVEHADLAQPVKKFEDMRSSNLNTNSPNGVSGSVIGPNEIDRRIAEAPVIGGVVLVPFNLVVSNQDTPSERHYRPIGKPKGVAGTNMRQIAPEDEFTVGPDTWKVFPEFSKTDTNVLVKQSGDYYTAGGMSHYVGIAYKVVG